MDRHGWIRSFFLAALLLGSGSLCAQTVVCSGEMEGRRVNGNLNVAGVCELEDVEVGGNVRVLVGGTLVASDVRIDGNLDANRATAVDLEETIIDGNLRLEELGGGASTVADTEVNGNVTLANNRSRIELLVSVVRGNVEVFANTGGVELMGNAIGGKLECAGNLPAPTVAANSVANGAEGQCADVLSPPPPSTPPVLAPRPPVSQPAPSPFPTPTPSAPPTDSTTSSFVPQPEGGGGAVGMLEIVWLPLLALGRLRRRLRNAGTESVGTASGATAGPSRYCVSARHRPRAV